MMERRFNVFLYFPSRGITRDSILARDISRSTVYQSFREVLIEASGGRSAASVIAITAGSLARRRHVTEDAATAGIQSRKCKWSRSGW